MVILSKLGTAPLALGYWIGVAGASERGLDCARILMFHGTPRRLAGVFEREMRFLKRQFDVVPLAALVSGLHSGPALKRKVALTFDDGLRNNVEVAYPILAKLGLPATFFVCPELIERKRWLWNHEARQRLKCMADARRRRLAMGIGAPTDIEGFIDFMKDLDVGSREKLEERVRAASPHYKPTAEEHEDFDLAGWEELARLDPAIVTIGSHTLTHPILPTLLLPDAENEVVQSRRAIESRLQREASLFAYPNGDYSPEVHEYVRRTYQAAVTTAPSWVEAGCDPHLLPRASAPWSTVRLAWNMHRAAS